MNQMDNPPLPLVSDEGLKRMQARAHAKAKHQKWLKKREAAKKAKASRKKNR